jgi:prepilin-type N-terminal cleavage/methylation domain-containing protein
VTKLEIVDCGLWNLNSELETPNSELQRGFTLIEMVVVIVILSIISVISIYFLINSAKIYALTINQKTLFDEGKLSLERMCRDIRDASNITSPAGGTSGGSITFTRAHATAQDNASENITFQLTGSTLQKVKNAPAGPTSAMAGNVSTFIVIRGASNEVQLQLSLSLGTGENVTLQTKVYPKNLADDFTFTYKNFFANWQEELSS